MKPVQIFTCFLVILLLILDSGHPQHSRRKGYRYYQNSLIKMHNHSWTVYDVFEALLGIIWRFLVPEDIATPRADFLFLFDSNDNGSGNFLGFFNVTKRDVYNVSEF